MVYKTDSTNRYKIDDRAKIAVQLEAKKDENGNTFHTGKLQFNGSLSLDDGQSFMVFISDENFEELQIGPLSNVKNSRRQINYSEKERICVKLKPHKDGFEKTYYVGELKGNGSISANKGLFFTIFTAIKGREELQISTLKINK